MEKKILTEFIYPPIRIRSCDWRAWIDGEEESGRYGYGKTQEQAIEDLKAQLED
jgi:hypothetical protein